VPSARRLNQKADRLRDKAQSLLTVSSPFEKYRGKPNLYSKEVLGITNTPDQEAILDHLHIPPYKILVPSGHATGKTCTAAEAANYWYDCYDPSVGISSAPRKQDVVDLLWTEVRLQRQRAGLPMSFTGPAAPEMRTGPDHYSKGYTSAKGEGYQGRHRRRMLFVFDEANGIEARAWTGVKTMFDPGLDHAWLCIFNPTDTTSQAYIEDVTASESEVTRWHRFRLDSTRHPNLIAELDGKPRPIPGAVSLAMLQDEWLKDWTEPVNPGDQVATDFAWPPVEWLKRKWEEEKGEPVQGETLADFFAWAAVRHGFRWYRPGPEFQARALGIWPDVGDGVWSPALFEACLQRLPDNWWHGLLDLLPEIGCDTATGKGGDYVGIHDRWGPVSIDHETSNTMDPVRIYEKLQLHAERMADMITQKRPRQAAPISPKRIRIKIDDDGTGGAVGKFLMRDGYTVVMVGAGTKASDPERYTRKRDELWFQTPLRAKQGRVNFSLIPAEHRRRIRQQLMVTAWELKAGRREVESKDRIKEKIGRSPDDADCLNLAYYDAGGVAVPEFIGNNDGSRTKRIRHEGGR
jgi:hypothetical protein